MTQELTRKRPKRPGGARSLASNPPWNGLALAAILLLSAFLNLYGLSSEGHPNNYYSAAVKNMLASWSNFFFVSFDAGFVSVDKPPLGLWIQAASAWLFGFSGLSLLLPQAIAGVLSVAVLYYLVRRTSGAPGRAGAGPHPDNSRHEPQQHDGHARGPVRAPGGVGLRRRRRAGKPEPAAPGRGHRRPRLQHQNAAGLPGAARVLPLVPARRPYDLAAALFALGAATAVLLAVSLSWAVAVDLTPSDQRPYVGGSEGDSALNLAFGYNGLERLLGRSDMAAGRGRQSGRREGAEKSPDTKEGDDAPKGGPGGGPGGGGPGGVGENGEPGPLRL